MTPDRPPVAIIGGGAAGLMAAVFAAGRGHRIVVLETTSDAGRKILISGGGRCNILPRELQPDRFVSESPRPLVRRLLRSWPLDHQIAFFEQDLGLRLKLEAETNKFFPVSDRARDVRDGLVALAVRRGVDIRFSTRVKDLSRGDRCWQIKTTGGDLQADAVILATGGRSVPATGSDGAGLDIARRLGHRIRPTYPALTPLTCDPAPFAALSGVSLNVRLRANWRDGEAESSGGFLFTHHGYSGPSVLDISHLPVQSRLAASDRASVRVRWTSLTPTEWTEALQSSGLVTGVVSRQLPARLAERLVIESRIPADRRVAELRREERAALIETLTSYELPWTGDEGYKKAEVTGGGVALEEVDHRTMESRVAPGLYLCGEILDAFGPIGGHNFAWAWATGRLAGLSATS